MEKEKVYKLIPFTYIGAVFSVLTVGFSMGWTPLAVSGFLSIPIYYRFITKWRQKKRMIRKDERLVQQKGKGISASFWIVFAASLGFYYLNWILGNYDLITPTLRSYGKVAGRFGLFTYVVYFLVLSCYGIKNWLERREIG